MIDNRLLLYIDILAFSDLATRDPDRVDDLYEVIASLNAHKHEAFKCVIFSDTILVYNVDGGDSSGDVSYLLMYLCEFAKDLLHRLTNRGILFRAVISQGYFRHYQLNEVPCFYGKALVDAYFAEKNIKAIGLFVQNQLIPYSDVFHTTPFNSEYSFVYITQALGEIEDLYGSDMEDLGDWLEQTDLTWMGGPELLHVVDVIRGCHENHPSSIHKKYVATYKLYKKKYPKIIKVLEDNGLDIKAIAPDADWTTVIERHPESCAYAIRSRKEF